MFTLLPINITLAIRSLDRHRFRTLLTMLGIVIGVAAVLTMVALGTGAKASVEGEVGSAGTNLVFVRAGNYTRGGESVGIVAGKGAAQTLLPSDAQAIATQVRGIADLSPVLSVRTFVQAGDKRDFIKVQGIAASFAKIYSWNVAPGKMFRDEGGPQAVLGKEAAGKLFGVGVDPVGKTVQLRDLVLTVTGVTDSASDDQKEVLFVPWGQLQTSLGVRHLEGVTLAAEKAGESSRIADDVKALLRKRHAIVGSSAPASQGYMAARGGIGGTPDDFTVETQAAQALTKGLYTPAAAFALANLPKLDEVTLDEMADTLDKASDTMTALLASIAGVSLIVGGIGIMNIMLVSITERTREIGLRMAAGARAADVGLQFLVEAITLSLAGGLLGLILGLLSAKLIGWALGWPASVPISSMVMALGISAAVGLIFGIYPARRASLLDPIQALRTE